MADPLQPVARRPEARAVRKAGWAGALTILSLLGIVAGGGLRFVPSETPLGPAARIFDALAPWWLGLALILALGTARLGLRRTGSALALTAAVCAGHLLWDHTRLSLPLVPDRPADLRLLFYNVLRSNAAFSHRIAAAATALDADLVVFAEGEAMYPALPALRKTHAFVSPCALDRCELLVAIRQAPIRFWRLTLNPVWDHRYAVAEIETKTGKRVFIAASHVAKPWLAGIAEPEQRRLRAQYDWLSGPVVAVGDFNAAPWSLPMRKLLEESGFRTLRRPFPSWPATAGAFGVPIDHVLVHNGARVVRIEPFGADLGSNHRGFVVEIALP